MTTVVRAKAYAYASNDGAPAIDVPVADVAPGCATAWVYGAFLTVLGRVPDVGGLESFSDALRNDGVTPADLIAAISSSPEAVAKRNHMIVSESEVFAVGAYAVVFGRFPAPSATGEIVSLLERGETPERALALLIDRQSQTDELRFPPPVVSARDVLPECIQLVVLGAVTDAETRTLTRGLVEGKRVQWLVRDLLVRSDRRLRTRLRTVFTAHVLAAEAVSAAAATAASRNSASTVNLQWRLHRIASKSHDVDS